MASKRSSTLKLLDRIKQNEIDQYASHLGAIRSRIQRIETELHALQERVNTEGRTSQPEYVAFLANFLQAIEFRRSVLTTQKSSLESDEAKLEADLVRLFSEAQVGRAALENLVRIEQAKEEAREMALLDDLALTTHRSVKRQYETR